MSEFAILAPGERQILSLSAPGSADFTTEISADGYVPDGRSALDLAKCDSLVTPVAQHKRPPVKMKITVREGHFPMLELYENLAVQVKCPPELLSVLKYIVPGDMLPLLLCLPDWREPKEAAEKLEAGMDEIEPALRKLFIIGLIAVHKRKYKTRSFYGILNTYLGEGRLRELSQDERKLAENYYLQSRLQIYDHFIESGRLQASSG